MSETNVHPDTSATDPEEIMLDLVGRWHDGAGAGRPLHDYLGLSWADYAAWVEGRLTQAQAVARMIEGRKDAGEGAGS